ncbi:MAG: hypothetical protein JNN08_15765 [Bryobacterales bacterium]|nr:hypothetical protein [Bryobacterales bacterium]
MPSNAIASPEGESDFGGLLPEADLPHFDLREFCAEPAPCRRAGIRHRLAFGCPPLPVRAEAGFVRSLVISGLLALSAYGSLSVLAQYVPLAEPLALLPQIWLFSALSLSWFLAAQIVTAFADRWSTLRLMCRHFSGEKFDSSFLPPLPGKQSHLNACQGNLIVYSGFSPFVGSGVPLSSWSFVADVKRDARLPDGRAETPKQFHIRDLYGAVSSAILRLGVPGLTIEDQIFISGKDVRHDARFFDEQKERPHTNVSAELVQELLAMSTPGAARHYRCVRVVDWQGELVVSFFFLAALNAEAEEEE